MTEIWFAIVAVFAAIFAVVEYRAFTDDKPSTTLSAQVWALRQTMWYRIPMFAGFMWLGHHFFNPLDGQGGGWDDFIVIVTAALVAIPMSYKPRKGL